MELDKPVVKYISSFLKKETLQKIKQTNEILFDSFYINRENDFMFHLKNGNWIEMSDPNEIQKNLNEYPIKKDKWNPFLWKHYDFMYNEIKISLSDYFKIQCDYHEKLNLPAIRIFKSKKEHQFFKYDMLHYDKPYYEWDKCIINKNIIYTISVTIIIDIPPDPGHSYFTYIPGTETQNYLKYKMGQKLPIEYYNNMINLKLEEGSAVIQVNHLFHGMGDLKFTESGQKRTSVQMFGLYDGEKIWLTI
jgi:hypothetical protein